MLLKVKTRLFFRHLNGCPLALGEFASARNLGYDYLIVCAQRFFGFQLSFTPHNVNGSRQISAIVFNGN